MRKRFEQVRELDAELIPEVKLDSRSRHALPKLLAGLQYIFMTPELNEQVFMIMEDEILVGNNKMGRLGMSLWEILVLGAIRLNLNTDYDDVMDLANYHSAVRGIMGIRTKLVFNDEGKYYPRQTIMDNVSLLSETCLDRISKEVIKAGHQLKKEEQEVLELHLKSDSYPVESNIHFPTDINLLWDSFRKCLDVINLSRKVVDLAGWRKIGSWYKNGKRHYRTTSNIHQKKGANFMFRLKNATTDYLNYYRKGQFKIGESLVSLLGSSDIRSVGLHKELKYYNEMLLKHIDLVDRRILKGEKIPHSEKVFSIFEPHVEWISKGKHHNKVDLGHNVLVTSDQYHFILDHKIMISESDSAQPIELANRLKKEFTTNYSLYSISFDRGFYSKLAKTALEKEFTHVFLPSKRKKGKPEVEEGETLSLIANKHSAVESNINELEHSGGDKVPDKGLPNFKKYVALSVLAYNIKRLGRIAIEKKLVNIIDRSKRKKSKAA